MSRTFELVRGELRVDGPDARGVSVRLEGGGNSLRVELGRGWSGLSPIVQLLPAPSFRRWLAREGIHLTLIIRGADVLELGDPSSGSTRLHPFAALWALRGVPVRHFAGVFRAARLLLRPPDSTQN